MGDNIIPKTLEGYIEVYMDFLELEVQEYLQRKQSQGLQVSSEWLSPLPQANQPVVLSPVNKVFTILQAPQQPEEIPQACTARQAAIEHQQNVASGVIAPNDTVSTKEGSAFTVDSMHRLSICRDEQRHRMIVSSCSSFVKGT